MPWTKPCIRSEIEILFSLFFFFYRHLVRDPLEVFSVWGTHESNSLHFMHVLEFTPKMTFDEVPGLACRLSCKE